MGERLTLRRASKSESQSETRVRLPAPPGVKPATSPQGDEASWLELVCDITIGRRSLREPSTTQGNITAWRRSALFADPRSSEHSASSMELNKRDRCAPMQGDYVRAGFFGHFRSIKQVGEHVSRVLSIDRYTAIGRVYRRQRSI